MKVTAAGLLPVTSSKLVGLVPLTSAKLVGLVPLTSRRLVGLVPVTSARLVGFVPVTSAIVVGLLPVTSAKLIGFVPVTSAKLVALLPPTSTRLVGPTVTVTLRVTVAVLAAATGTALANDPVTSASTSSAPSAYRVTVHVDPPPVTSYSVQSSSVTVVVRTWVGARAATCGSRRVKPRNTTRRPDDAAGRGKVATGVLMGGRVAIGVLIGGREANGMLMEGRVAIGVLMGGTVATGVLTSCKVAAAGVLVGAGAVGGSVGTVVGSAVGVGSVVVGGSAVVVGGAKPDDTTVLDKTRESGLPRITETEEDKAGELGKTLDDDNVVCAATTGTGSVLAALPCAWHTLLYAASALGAFPFGQMRSKQSVTARPPPATHRHAKSACWPPQPRAAWLTHDSRHAGGGAGATFGNRGCGILTRGNLGSRCCC